MKHTFRTAILLLAILLPWASRATIVTDIQARKAGINFYYQQLSRIHPVNYNDLRVSGSSLAVYDGVPSYWVFNIENGGFVIVSACAEVTPVLGYSFESNLPDTDLPPQFNAWMEGYSKQIAYSVNSGLQATPAVAAEWARLGTDNPATLVTDGSGRDVSPLLISTWDQTSPYNFMCPADGSGPGGHVLAGCVATAMSQVMYYYRWPLTGEGSHCYDPQGYPEQCADYANTTYKWEEMLNSIGSRDTAMGLIQWHAGIGVNMMYGASSSGAYSWDAMNAFKDFFKYNPNISLEDKENYSDEAWAQLMRDNLDAGRPMYYHGFGTGGHAFNLDGYQSNDYFHFNWGWSGTANGYYYLTNLNPSGMNFTEGQGAIINLYPDTVAYIYPSYCSGQTVLTHLYGTFEDGSGPVKKYQDNANASWLITPQSSSDSVISITISFSRFETEAGNDIVNIYSGTVPESSNLIATYSGTSIPPAVTITGNKALVTFTTNSSVTAAGWYATYTTQKMIWCQGTTVLSDPSGSISDGSYNFDYQNNSVCRWRLLPEGTGAMLINFTSFNTEAGMDFVKIYDLTTEQLVGEFSGEYTSDNLPSVLVPGGQAFILFSTNGINTRPGWTADYITYAVGTEENTIDASFMISPNPNHGQFQVTFSYTAEGTGTFDLVNVSGQVVLHVNHDLNKGINKVSIDASGIPSGMYILRFTGAEGTVVKKVVVSN